MQRSKFGARCCIQHLINHQLSVEAVNQVKPVYIKHQELNSSDVQLILSKAQNFLQTDKKRFNFDDARNLNDSEYQLLTGLSRDNFDDLIRIITSFDIRSSSCNRSIRTAVGIYLCKLRFGVSNTMLACMFQIEDKRTISRIINSARQAILQKFVSGNLGFEHITREDVMSQHTTTIAREPMYGDDNADTAILVIDGTYVYIQVKKCFEIFLHVIF